MSRNVEDLTPQAQIKFHEWHEGMARASIDYLLTCTKRTKAEQLELYKKGREFKQMTILIGGQVTEGKWIVVDPKKCVTWTLESNHLSGNAWDFAIMQHGKPVWNASLDIDGDGIAEYTEAGLIAERLGLVWGGRFKNSKGQPRPDAPHIELP